MRSFRSGHGVAATRDDPPYLRHTNAPAGQRGAGTTAAGSHAGPWNNARAARVVHRSKRELWAFASDPRTATYRDSRVSAQADHPTHRCSPRSPERPLRAWPLGAVIEPWPP